MFADEGIQRKNGMSGFDWAIHKGDRIGVTVDMSIAIFTTVGRRHRLRSTASTEEGLSGSKSQRHPARRRLATRRRSSVDVQYDQPRLSQAGIDRIDGLESCWAAVAGHAGSSGDPRRHRSSAGNIILGGDGSDIIEGRGGDDLIDGDAGSTCASASMGSEDTPMQRDRDCDTLKHVFGPRRLETGGQPIPGGG